MSTRTTSALITDAMASSLGYQVNLTGKLFGAALSAGLPAGMTGAQVGLLAWVAQHPGQSQKQISEGTTIDPATLTEMVRRLERRGVLRRVQDPADARRTLVTLVDDQVPGLRDALDAAAQVNRRAVRGMTSEEVETLNRLLARVQANLR